jgi:hypothetical protein
MHTIMSINARGYRPYSRNSSNKLGNNAVDEAANLSPYVKQGSNLVVRPSNWNTRLRGTGEMSSSYLFGHVCGRERSPIRTVH